MTLFCGIRAKFWKKPAAVESLARDIGISAAPSSVPVSDLAAELWDAAYNEAKRREGKLVEAYETILSAQQLLSAQLEKDAGQDFSAPMADDPYQLQDLSLHQNVIPADPMKRRQKMQGLLKDGMKRAERKAKFQKGVETAAEIVSMFKEVVDKAIQASPQAALAWVGVCVVLQLFLNPIEEVSASRSGIAYVVSRMEYYWNMPSLLFHENIQDTWSDSAGPAMQMKESITELYTILLLYEMKTVCYHHRNRFIQITRSLFKLDGWKTELSDIKDAERVLEARSLQYNTGKIRKDLGRLFDWSETHNAKLDDLAAAVEKQTTAYHEQQAQKKAADELKKRNRLKKDLFASDSADDKKRIEETEGGLLDEAYAWILQSTEFLAWKDNPDYRLLWINGDAGKGKTMMLCGVINELEATQDSATVSYFFCQASNDSLNSAVAVLRGLIYSLISKRPFLMKHVEARYNGHDSSLFKNHNAWIVVQEIFLNMIRDPALGCVYLLIDALDECITSLDELMRLVNLGHDEAPQVTWVLTSRPWPEIELSLRKVACKGTLSLEDSSNAISEAVALFTRIKADQLAEEMAYHPSTKEAVLHHLSENAGNTFLWVSLVCEVLKREPAWNVNKQTLENLPHGLRAIYQRMTKHIRDSGDKGLIYARVLKNAMVACRPLSLLELITSVEELQDIADQPEQIRDVVRRCGSFLSIQQGFVYFVHYSAKEYLTEHETEWSVDGVNPHYTMVSRALHVMSTDLKRDMYCLKAPDSRADTVQPPIPDTLAPLRYSCLYWGDHLNELRAANSTLYNRVASAEGPLQRFLTTAFLYWIEAISLCNNLGKGIAMMAQLHGHLEDSSTVSNTKTERHDNDFKSLVTDAYRFIMYHHPTIERYPLQVYSSALTFSPSNSKIAKIFWSEKPKEISIIRNPHREWNSCLQTLEYEHCGSRRVALTPCSTLLATSSGGAVRVFDVRNSTPLCTFYHGAGNAIDIAISPDTMFVATAGDTVALWSSKTGRCIRIFDGHRLRATTIHFSPDSKCVLSGSKDETLKEWDIDQGKCLDTYKHDAPVASAVYSHDGTLIAADCERGLSNGIYIFSCQSKMPIKKYWARGIISPLAFSHDSSLVAWTTRNGIHSWKWETEEIPFSVTTDIEPRSRVQFLHGLDIAVTCCADFTLKIWRVATGECLQTLTGHGDRVSSIAVSRNMTLASASWEGAVKLWKVDSAQWSGQAAVKQDEAGSTSGSYDATTSHAYLPYNFFVSSGVGNGKTTIWSMEDGKRVLDLTSCHPELFVKVFALSSDNRFLAAGYAVEGKAEDEEIETERSVVRILDLSEPGWKETRERHQSYITAVRFSPDSSLVASSACDRTIKIWKSTTRELLQTLQHEYEVTDVMFANDKRLLSVSPGGVFNIWDVSGTRLQTLNLGTQLRYDDRMAVSSDATHLAIITYHMRMRALKILNLDDGAMSGPLDIDATVKVTEFTADRLHLQTCLGVVKIPRPENGWLALQRTLDGVQYQGAGIEEVKVGYRGPMPGASAPMDTYFYERWITHNGKPIVRMSSDYQSGQCYVSRDRIGMLPPGQDLLLYSVS